MNCFHRPLRADEVLPVRTHHIVTDAKTSEEGAGEGKSKKKKKDRDRKGKEKEKKGKVYML